MSISCYIVIQIVSEEIYFLKGSLFKAAARLKLALPAVFCWSAHACPKRGQSAPTASSLCQVGSVLQCRRFTGKVPGTNPASSPRTETRGLMHTCCPPECKPLHPRGSWAQGSWILEAVCERVCFFAQDKDGG
jgi:hypothetical protein